jgi:hypothetical protein
VLVRRAQLPRDDSGEEAVGRAALPQISHPRAQRRDLLAVILARTAGICFSGFGAPSD